MTITLSIPTEQGYDQSFIFTKNGYVEFNDLVKNRGKKTIDNNWILEVTEKSVILYKSATFDPKSYTGPNYVMSREDAKLAIKEKDSKKVIKIDDPIRYGKYDGISWMDLPNDYLLWLQKNMDKNHKDMPYVKGAISYQEADL